jgi:proline iminopeptidase
VPDRYPPIEPFQDGLLDVGDGQLVYWEQAGDPDGRPAVVLHGGPGSGCSPWMRPLFDPRAYRVVLFDQRGAGRSRPHASDPAADLAVNTTSHLIADIERLREHLGIGRWLVYGLSWGSTLGLAYAQAHPQRVTEVVLDAVTMTRRSDVDWFACGVGRFFPAEWQAFRDAVPAADRDGDLVAAYARLLASADVGVPEQAARDWCAWEQAIVSLETGGTPSPRYADPRFRMGFARLVTHYFSHAAFLEEDQLLREAHRLTGIPGVLIHGRLDLGAPPHTAWQLAQAWPGSELIVLETSGHTSNELEDHVVAATDRFARLRRE